MNFDKSKVCHPFKPEMAEKYIGCKGWFAGSESNLMTIIGQPDNRSTLSAVLKEEGSPFQNRAGWRWNYFYPAEEPAEYRPYETIEEAMEAWGKVLIKKSNQREKMVGGEISQDNDSVWIRGYPAYSLFENYTFSDGSPVGVKK